MAQRLSYLAFLVTGVFASACVQAEAQTQIDMSVVGARAEYVESDPILVGVRFVNVGSTDVVMSVPDLCERQLDVVVTDAAGNRVSTLKPCESAFQLAALRLAPGEGHVMLLPLAWHHAIRAPGTYSVSATYEISAPLPVYEFGTPGEPRLTAPPVRAEAASIQVSVVSPRTERERAAADLLRHPSGRLSHAAAATVARDFRDLPAGQYAWKNACVGDRTAQRRQGLEEFLRLAGTSEFAPFVRLALAEDALRHGRATDARAILDAMPRDHVLTMDAGARLRRDVLEASTRR